jgi:hypothetical protein
MIRKPRNYLPHLSAEYARQHPDRPPKNDFNDELLVVFAVLMRQIDPTGKRPMIEPAAFPEGYDPEPSVKASGRRRISDDG